MVILPLIITNDSNDNGHRVAVLRGLLLHVHARLEFVYIYIYTYIYIHTIFDVFIMTTYKPINLDTYAPSYLYTLVIMIIIVTIIIV